MAGNGDGGPAVVTRSIPSVQTKRSEASEHGNLLKYGWMGFGAAMAIAYGAYAFANFVITGDDWPTFVHMAFMLIPVSTSLIFLSMRWWKNQWVWWDSIWTYIVLFILHLLVFTVLVVATTDFWIWVWRWRGLDKDWLEGVAVFSVVVAFPIASAVSALPLIMRVIHELVDATYDAIEPRIKKMELDHEKWKWEREHPRPVTPIIETDGDEREFIPRATLPKPDMGKDERMKEYIKDFFDGLVHGTIGMTKRDWNTKKRLPRSHMPLNTTNAIRARDALIKAGYLELVNPNNDKEGVRFVDSKSPDELLQLLLSGNGKNIVRVNGETNFGIPSVTTEREE